MNVDKNCKECGCDKFRCTDYDKVTKTLSEVGWRFKRIHADHALEKAEWQLREIQLEESMKYMQQKTKKQTAALRKLEQRILKLGRRPYEEPRSAADIEPGDLLFRDTVVITRVEYSADRIVITGQFAPQETAPEITGM